MLNEINLIAGGAIAGVASGALGLLISSHGMRRARSRTDHVREQLAWERHESPELTRNLLFLEMVGDEIESSPTDVAVRARLTPSELREARRDLTTAGLVDEPIPNLLRLTDAGRDVLAQHKLELQESLLNRRRHKGRRSPPQSPEDLDRAIDSVVDSLRTQHA